MSLKLCAGQSLLFTESLSNSESPVYPYSNVSSLSILLCENCPLACLLAPSRGLLLYCGGSINRRDAGRVARNTFSNYIVSSCQLSNPTLQYSKHSSTQTHPQSTLTLTQSHPIPHHSLTHSPLFHVTPISKTWHSASWHPLPFIPQETDQQRAR